MARGLFLAAIIPDAPKPQSAFQFAVGISPSALSEISSP